MKHAGPAVLRDLEPLLMKLREITVLTERKPGIFYLRASAFLHFHEDAAGIFVDVKLDGKSFERRKLCNETDQTRLLTSISTAIAGGTRVKSRNGEHA